MGILKSTSKSIEALDNIIFVYINSILGVELINIFLPTASFLIERYLTEPAAKISPWRLLPPPPIITI
jgi:hypothetical protein